MSLSDYVVTEAGFAADLGAEKFLNIKCRKANLSPKAVVIVATIRALKYHGGKPLSQLKEEDTAALAKGIPNLEKHIESIQSFGLPVVVSINAFSDDTQAEKELIYEHCEKLGVPVALSYGWADGGKGCVELAEKVVAAAESSTQRFTPTYALDDSPLQKIEKICRKIYGARKVVLSAKAKKQLSRFESLGFSKLPICMAKTQKSLSDNEKLLGRPENFDIHIREFEIAAGAGFIIPIAGNMLRMPGLPVIPSAENIKMDGNGIIEGLF
jgi:formate--tetrahydrofolate ligase